MSDSLFYEEELVSQKGAANALERQSKLKYVPRLLAGTANSPFLHGTNIQFATDSTSLGYLKTCPRLYEYTILEGWRSRGESVHLKFGQLYHSGLETYDKLRAQGYEHEIALHEVTQWAMEATWERSVDMTGPEPDSLHHEPTSGPWVSDHHSKNRETLIRSIIWYLDEFRNDPAATLILANGKPAVELSFRMEMEWGPEAGYDEKPQKLPVKQTQPYLLCGHLDRVVEFGGQRYVLDRKTTGSSPTPHYFDGFAPDNQMSIYTLAARVQFSTPVAGVIIDAAQVAVGFTRFQRGFTYRTEAQLEEWLADFRFWTAQAEGFAEASHWPMNDRSCGMYGGCTFRKICSKSPEVRERFLESDFERRPWNPLQSR
jgi:hypothetical protein